MKSQYYRSEGSKFTAAPFGLKEMFLGITWIIVSSITLKSKLPETKVLTL